MPEGILRTFSNVQYLGSFAVVNCDQVSRAEFIRNQLQQLRVGSKRKTVLLVVTLAGIKVCIPDGTVVRMAHALRRISYATCDPERLLFSFLAREPRGHFSLQYCHSFVTESPQQLPTESVVTLTDYKTCKTDVKSYMSMDFKPGEKTFNIDIDAPSEINKMFNINIVADKWTGTAWKKNIFSNTGQLCEYIEKSSDKFIDKITQLSKPKVEKKCPWKKGSYKIIKFPTVYNSKEYNFPSIIMGKFRINAKVLKGKSVVACFVLEAESAMK